MTAQLVQSFAQTDCEVGRALHARYKPRASRGSGSGPNGYLAGTRLNARTSPPGMDTGRRKEVQAMLKEIIKFIVTVASLVGTFFAVVRQGRVLSLWS